MGSRTIGERRGDGDTYTIHKHAAAIRREPALLRAEDVGVVVGGGFGGGPAGGRGVNSCGLGLQEREWKMSCGTWETPYVTWREASIPSSANERGGERGPPKCTERMQVDGG